MFHTSRVNPRAFSLRFGLLPLAAISCALLWQEIQLSSACAAESPSEQTARAAIAMRLRDLQNLTVNFRLHEEYTPPPGLKERVEAANQQGQGRSYVRDEKVNYECVFRYLQGRYWFEKTLIDDDLATKLPTFLFKHEIHCSFGNGFERLYQAINRSAPIGDIDASEKSVALYLSQLVDVGLGVRAWDDHASLTDEEIQKLPMAINADLNFELRRRDDSSRRMHIWQFDPRHDYALIRYSVVFADSPSRDYDFTCSDFTYEGGIMLPYRIEARRFGSGDIEEQPVIYSALMEINAYKLNSLENTPESFHITWPVGSAVRHEKRARTFHVSSRPQVLDEARIEEISKGGNAPAPGEKSPTPHDGAGEASPKFDFYTVDHYDDARSPADDLAKTIERAKAEHKRILVQVGGDWCGWCKLMSKFIETNDAVRENISQNYLLMKVTWDQKQRNEDFLSQYPKISGYPHLFVLDSEGKLLHSQDTSPLEEGQGYNEKVYLEFLDKWKLDK